MLLRGDGMGRDDGRAVMGLERTAANAVALQSGLNVFLETTPDLVWLKDADGVYITCNHAFERFVGRPVADILGKRDHDLVPHELAEFFRAKDKAAMRAGRVCINRETVTFAADGRRHVLETRKAPVRNAEGRATGVLGIARDITDALEAESRLRQSHDLLRAMVRRQDSAREAERRQLAYDLHEGLAQDLMALRMSVSMLQMQTDQADMHGQLEALRDALDGSVTRMREMVSALRPVVLDHGVNVALRWLVDDFARCSGLRIELSTPDELSLDEEMTTFLFRAAQESLLNVVMHGDAKRAEVRLAVVEGVCELSVRDDGRGFDHEGLRPEGALGLLHIQEQAKRFGGRLRVLSRPGQGAILCVEVPLSSGLPGS